MSSRLFGFGRGRGQEPNEPAADRARPVWDRMGQMARNNPLANGVNEAIGGLKEKVGAVKEKVGLAVDEVGDRAHQMADDARTKKNEMVAEASEAFDGMTRLVLTKLGREDGQEEDDDGRPSIASQLHEARASFRARAQDVRSSVSQRAESVKNRLDRLLGEPEAVAGNARSRLLPEQRIYINKFLDLNKASTELKKLYGVLGFDNDAPAEQFIDTFEQSCANALRPFMPIEEKKDEGDELEPFSESYQRICLEGAIAGVLTRMFIENEVKELTVKRSNSPLSPNQLIFSCGRHNKVEFPLLGKPMARAIDAAQNILRLKDNPDAGSITQLSGEVGTYVSEGRIEEAEIMIEEVGTGHDPHPEDLKLLNDLILNATEARKRAGRVQQREPGPGDCRQS